MQPDRREEVVQVMRQLLAEGFTEPSDLLDEAMGRFEDDEDVDEVRSAAPKIRDEVVAEHELAVAGWPEVTDCDRLDAAFEELNAKGIMARHHWTCCGTCGAAEMPDEFERLDGEWEGVPIIGYAFYHWQDTESAADGYGICLNYGSTEGAQDEATYNEQSVAVGKVIASVLRSHGLTVDWDESIRKRITVELDWKRRRKPARFVGT